ncbi:MAG: hypothetical protein NDJ90_04355 [Oligoflexia bacterium]|nr:hypothetical protein [Oligoflexia bacterium]
MKSRNSSKTKRHLTPEEIEEQFSPFTLDEKTSSHLAEMPSITKLLNRKKLDAKPPAAPPSRATKLPPKPEISKGADFTRPALPESVPEAPLEASAASPNFTPASIHRVSRSKRRQAASPLIQWHLSQLQNGKDPLGLGIAYLLDHGATAALFLAFRPEGTVNRFIATAYTGATTKLTLWNGLQWDPSIAPSLWNYFVKSGYLELPPPGTTTNQMSDRNVIRAAFGVQGTEWLLLLRAGPNESCRGVVAILSPKSLLAKVDAALKLLSAKSPAAKTA